MSFAVALPALLALTLPQLLVRLTVVPVFLATCLGLLRFRHLARPLRYLTGLLAYVLPLNVAALGLLLLRRNNLFLMPLYTVGELWGLTLVYGQVLHAARFRRLTRGLAGGYTLYVLADCLLTDLGRYRPGQQVGQSLLVLLLVGAHFRQLLHELRVRRLGQDPMFWVSSGLWLYFLGYLQIALFSNFLLRYSPQLNVTVWAVHSLLAIIMYGCYCRALWLSPPK